MNNFLNSLEVTVLITSTFPVQLKIDNIFLKQFIQYIGNLIIFISDIYKSKQGWLLVQVLSDHVLLKLRTK